MVKREMGESELVLGRCPAHPEPLEEVAETNWFFRLSRYLNERAGRDLEALGGEGPRPRHHPDWHIVSPLPVEVLRSYYAEAKAATGIPWAPSIMQLPTVRRSCHAIAG